MWREYDVLHIADTGSTILSFHLYELHRLLGIRSVQYNSVEMSRKQRELLWSQSDPVFLEGTRPEWISSEPSDPDLKKKCIASARRLPVVPGKALLVKFGDETRVLSGALLKKAGVRKQLSEFEAKILGYYLDGLSCREIAETVGKPPKSVDNAVQRIRRKVARQLLSGDLSTS